MKKLFSVSLALILLFSMAGVLQAAAVPQKLDCELSEVDGQLKYCAISAEVVKNELIVHGIFVNVGASPVEKIEKLNLKVFDKTQTQIAEGVFTGDKELAKASLKPGEVQPWDFAFDQYKKGDLSAVNTAYEFEFLAASEPTLPAGINIVVENQQIKPEVAPFIKNGSTLVPLRAIFEALKVEVNWDGNTQTVTAKTADGGKMTLIIGAKELDVNGNKIAFDMPAEIVGGSTFVPLRAVSEALGSHVFYGKSNDVVVISIVSLN